MKRRYLLAGAALALTSAWAVAQDAPESLLPPGFDRPAPRPSRSPAAAAPSAPQAAAPAPTASPVVQPIPVGRSASTGAAAASGPVTMPSGLPPLEVLEAMSPDQLDAALGLTPKDDIPPAARRAMQQVGVLGEAEGGLPAWNLARQDPQLVGAVLAGNSGRLVSRWGHILLRRALASRLDAPEGLDPAQFTAARAALLVRMGEADVARAVVQDVDTANFNAELTQAAIDAYASTGDFTGICPVVALKGAIRKDKPWQVLQAMCDSFTGEGTRSMAALDRLTYYGAMPRIDMLLAQRYAGAAGKARRAVNIEWNQVKDMTPWRFGMTTALGLQPPAALMKDAAPSFAYQAALSPALALDGRAAAADRAAACGILSSAAMVDLYSQLYDEDDANGEWGGRAARLRDAYAADTAANRLAAMKDLWGDASDPARRYSRQVLTAYAAARLPVNDSLGDDASMLIATMLAAGLEGSAARWAPAVKPGSEGWALLAVGLAGSGAADRGAVDDFHGDDGSTGARKSGFLVAGLAGLGRLPLATATELAGSYGFPITRASRWSQAIDRAAEFGNPTLVVLLAGLGMQGDSWTSMTPRNLYHIVSALNRVGLGAEARMIAAEAVARG